MPGCDTCGTMPPWWRYILLWRWHYYVRSRNKHLPWRWNIWPRIDWCWCVLRILLILISRIRLNITSTIPAVIVLRFFHNNDSPATPFFYWRFVVKNFFFHSCNFWIHRTLIEIVLRLLCIHLIILRNNNWLFRQHFLRWRRYWRNDCRFCNLFFYLRKSGDFFLWLLAGREVFLYFFQVFLLVHCETSGNFFFELSNFARDNDK